MTGGNTLANDRALAVLGRLTRGMLHEIANPLLALTGSTELALLDVEPDSKVQARLQVVQATGQELTQIVRTLQGFVRSQGEPAARIAVAQAAETAVELVRRVVPLGDVRLALRVDGEPTVHAPPGAVAAALVELLLDGIADAGRDGVVELAVHGDGDDAVASVGARELRLGAA